MWVPFASHKSFLDPTWTSDGKSYAPERQRTIIEECYVISKQCHTSYNDVLDMSPTERQTLLSIIASELTKQKEMIDSIKQQNKR